MNKSSALLLCTLAGLGGAQARAAQESADADLLEFLGSIGAEEDWQDYLEQKPLKDAAVKPVKDVRTVPAKSPATSAAPAPSKEKDK